MNAASILRPEINIPVEVALKFEEGKLVEGQFGDQVMFTWTNGQRSYLPPIVADKIKELGLSVGEPFTLCKRSVREPGARKDSIRWIVERAGELEKQLAASVELAKKKNGKSAPPAEPRTAELTDDDVPPEMRSAPEPRPTLAREVRGSEGASNSEVNPSLKNGTTPFCPRTILESCLITAAAAAKACEDWAKANDYSVRFTSEDVRTMANTLYIQRRAEQR